MNAHDAIKGRETSSTPSTGTTWNMRRGAAWTPDHDARSHKLRSTFRTLR